MENYTAEYFKKSLPEWKRKKDAFLAKIFYRPVSFYISSFFANKGIGANNVSALSIIVVVLACAAFFTCTALGGISGAVLVNVWLILDCTDGNLARAVQKQPYGKFVDALSSYLLIGLLFNILGLYACKYGGMLFRDNVIIVFIGALASSFDSLMRLAYQKYVNTSVEWGENALVRQDGSNSTKIDRLRIRVDAEMTGIFPLALLMASIFHFMDIVVIVWAVYYGAVLTATLLFLLFKVWKKQGRNTERRKAV